MNTPVIAWFRRNLRLSDNPALVSACQTGRPVIPVFIWDEDPVHSAWPMGAASKVWLHDSLQMLDIGFQQAGSKLLLKQGNPIDVLMQLVLETRANTVIYDRRFEPEAIDEQNQLESALTQAGIRTESHLCSVLYEPNSLKTNSGKPYQVFTAFWRSAMQWQPSQPLAAPARIPAPDVWPDSLTLAELNLKPTIRWDESILNTWQPGERSAQQKLREFMLTMEQYPQLRDRMDCQGTSCLSPYLCFGEISPRQVWWMIEANRNQLSKAGIEAANSYLRQLAWREFAHYLMFHFPHTVESALKPEFDAFPWIQDPERLKRWQQGKTGYPIVDAGMRQLWQTGWMHNRVRMITASFLIKDLGIHWMDGAKWFWDTLVDADLANNIMGWQWVAGCGADAAPYFRVFNPVTQAENFDPDGAYIRTWVPELRRLSGRWIHKPWLAPESTLKDAGILLGETYPWPMVDHSEARNKTLADYTEFRKSLKDKKQSLSEV